MVAFITLLSATATLFLACTNVVANPTPDTGIPALLARRGSVDTSKFSEACKSSCEPFANIFVNPSCDDTCQCKDASIDLAGACYSCAAAQKADYDIKGAQGVIDGIVKDCKDAGLPVKSINITGGKNGAVRLGALGSGAVGVMAIGVVLALA